MLDMILRIKIIKFEMIVLLKEIYNLFWGIVHSVQLLLPFILSEIVSLNFQMLLILTDVTHITDLIF